MNLHEGRGLVLFLVNPATKEYETSFFCRCDLTEVNLIAEGFVPEVVPHIIEHSDAYVHGLQYAAVAGRRIDGAVTEFSLLLADLDRPKNFAPIEIDLN